MKFIFIILLLLQSTYSSSQEDYSDLFTELNDKSVSIEKRGQTFENFIKGIHMQTQVKLQRMRDLIPLLTSFNEPEYYFVFHAVYGSVMQELGENLIATEEFYDMLKFAKEQKNDAWISESHMGLYKVYVELQMHDKALESIKLAQKHAALSGNARKIEVSSYLLGYNFYTLGQNDSATIMMQIAIDNLRDNDSIPFNREYNYMLGRIYLRDGAYQKGVDKLRELYNYTLRFEDDADDYVMYYRAGSLMYLAQGFALLGELDSSDIYFERCLKLYKNEDPQLYELAYYYNAGTYAKIGEYERAAPLFDYLIDSTDFPVNLIEAARTYSHVNELDRSIFYYDLALVEKDSANKASISEMTSLLNESAEAEVEIQKQIDEEKRSAAENEAESQERQKNLILLSAGLIGLLIIFFGRVLFKRYQIIKAQKEEIIQQKLEVEEKNEEILDSISYAKRIQDAILPPIEKFNALLPNSFILYKPKDVVAGDFYWLEEVGDKIIFAAADCTGHGVPGAMVSVICHNALNRSVREFGLIDPAKILDKTRELVIETFESSVGGEGEIKDGMDISLCCFDKKSAELQYAGANNPLYLFRNGELKETKADKQPIGAYTKPFPFSNHSISLIQGDQLFIFTDGFVDQFGGEKGKKFKYKNFRDLLLRYQDEKAGKQQILLDTAFEKWKGGFEQLDDVCVIGVRI
jgi:serine phosphatase RsbU (regulator of sigma subunit)